MILYNLFPPLAGTFTDWRGHIERASELGCDWVFVNPVQKPGRSGSLYSIFDYFALNPLFVDDRIDKDGFDQLREAIGDAQKLGLEMMTDLVINHCAVDAPLCGRHPEWFVRDNGKLAHPFCVEPDGTKVVWKDLARFDYEHTPDPSGLFDYVVRVVEQLLELGFRGFRCDAAYQVPARIWQRLIRRIKGRSPRTVFVAETLGCSPQKTLATATAGFDWIFNSSKWWDFEAPWLLKQYELTRLVAPSIGFPESHDTERLFAETGGSEAAMKQRYLFTALFSSGVMLPVGFEFGFRKRLHVVDTRPTDWETPNLDLRGFIAATHQVKRTCPVFAEECRARRFGHENPRVLVLHKGVSKTGQQALLLLNRDIDRRQQVWFDSFSRFFSKPGTLRCVSPENPMTVVHQPFHYELRPGEAVVIVSDPAQ